MIAPCIISTLQDYGTAKENRNVCQDFDNSREYFDNTLGDFEKATYDFDATKLDLDNIRHVLIVLKIFCQYNLRLFMKPYEILSLFCEFMIISKRIFIISDKICVIPHKVFGNTRKNLILPDRELISPCLILKISHTLWLF